MKKFLLAAGLLAVLFIPRFVNAQGSALRDQIAQIAAPAKGIVGVSVLNIETGDTVSYNGKARLILQSVMKFPIALTVLHLVDSGTVSLSQMVHISKKELVSNTSAPASGPIPDKFPKGTNIAVSDLLRYMISQSDNTACDALLKLISGPQTVQNYMLRLGIRGIAVRASETDMAMSWELQYTNWCKPTEMTVLLNKFYKDSVLTKPSTDLLYKLMTDATTGPNRIKALLPPGTIIAHKTGTSPTSEGRLTPATNDAGIITLPNGKHIAVAVFVCNSTDDEATREGIIAKIAKAAFDHYSKE